MADPHAELIFSTTSESEQQSVRDRMAKTPAPTDGDLLDA